MEAFTESIRKQFASNDAVVFIGSGISSYTTKEGVGGQRGEEGVATWKGLLKDGLKKCLDLQRTTQANYDYYKEKFSQKDCTTDDYLEAANLILSSFKMEKKAKQVDIYKEWLKDTVGSLVPKNRDLIEYIGKLDCPIFTTNYDNLLEVILDRKPLTWDQYESEGIGDSFANLKKYVVHVHGYFEQPESVVLSQSGYNDILNNEFAQSKLKALMETKTLLFIGFGSGMSDPNFFNLLTWKNRVSVKRSLPIYKIVRLKPDMKVPNEFETIATIPFGTKDEELVSFIRNLIPTPPLTVTDVQGVNEKRSIVYKKYLNFLLQEYSTISIFGYSKTELKLPLQRVFVDLKFDPTKPSTKAMKVLQIFEVFKRKLFSGDLFKPSEQFKIYKAYSKLCSKNNAQNVGNLCRNFLIEQWVNNLLDDKEIFTNDEAESIKGKISKLKKQVMEIGKIKDEDSYSITRTCKEFKHFIILGHPGSGKTTLSKWLVTNIARQALGSSIETTTTLPPHNDNADEDAKLTNKLPILIPIWKYIEKKQENEQNKLTLLEYIYEYATLDSQFFSNSDEKLILSDLIKEELRNGNTLVILEGLDEIPVHINRSDLMNEINSLFEHPIEYDKKTHKMVYSVTGNKEVCVTDDSENGNRFIVTSRIEGNYFAELNVYVPRLTIEDMSNDALKLFCNSYMESIRDAVKEGRDEGKQFDHDQLYNDITKNEELLKLAINPQLASVIASVYNQYDGALPDKRIDLYEKAIDKMTERLINLFKDRNHTLPDNLKVLGSLDKTVILTIMQEIAKYLHSRTEGLSEHQLTSTVSKCLLEYKRNSIQSKEPSDYAHVSITSTLVDLLKVHSGLLCEFGHDSFKFIHRTFQEYLAAVNLVYYYGIERSEDAIYDNIMNCISIPNWRVPLSMLFGILSKTNENNKLFDNIIERLFSKGNTAGLSSSGLVPFVLIDSLNDISFSSKDKEQDLIGRLAELLISDYSNMQGFSRIKEHRDLIEAYFFKLKSLYENYLIEWFTQTVESKQDSYIVACSSLLLKLKLYSPNIHKSLLKQLHRDSSLFQWSIDSLLRYYAKCGESEPVSQVLKFKNAVKSQNEYVNAIQSNPELFRLVAALYGIYEDKSTKDEFIEWLELCSFYNLPERQQQPFTFYFQEIWGKENTIDKMEMRIDAINKTWKNGIQFDLDEIYKDSFILTPKALMLIEGTKSIEEMKQELSELVSNNSVSLGDKSEALLSVVALGTFYDIDHDKVLDGDTRECLKKRVQQLMASLSEPIIRLENVESYLIEMYNYLKGDHSSNLQFIYYCKMFLFLNAQVGGKPLASYEFIRKVGILQKQNLFDESNKEFLLAEFLSNAFTSYYYDENKVVDGLKDIIEFDFSTILKSFHRINTCVQLYKPIRSYLWPLDVYLFKYNHENDIPNWFFCMIESLDKTTSCKMKSFISKTVKEDGLLTRNPDLIILYALFIYGDMSANSQSLRDEVLNDLLPEITKAENQMNLKEFFLNKTDLSVTSVYYKSRIYCKLAGYYDYKCVELLTKAYELALQVDTPVLRFQLIESIFTTAIYKMSNDDSLDKQRRNLIKSIPIELAKIVNDIKDEYDKVIGLTRLALFSSTKSLDRHKYLKLSIETVEKVNNDHDKIELISRLSPLVGLYDDLREYLNKVVIEGIKDEKCRLYVKGNYGKVLIDGEIDFIEKAKQNHYSLIN